MSDLVLRSAGAALIAYVVLGPFKYLQQSAPYPWHRLLDPIGHAFPFFFALFLALLILRVTERLDEVGRLIRSTLEGGGE